VEKVGVMDIDSGDDGRDELRCMIGMRKVGRRMIRKRLTE